MSQGRRPTHCAFGRSVTNYPTIEAALLAHPSLNVRRCIRCIPVSGMRAVAYGFPADAPSTDCPLCGRPTERCSRWTWAGDVELVTPGKPLEAKVAPIVKPDYRQDNNRLQLDEVLEALRQCGPKATTLQVAQQLQRDLHSVRSMLFRLDKANKVTHVKSRATGRSGHKVALWTLVEGKPSTTSPGAIA